MLCEKNIKLLEEEIEKLERSELTWQTCDKLCMLYRIREHMHKECEEHAGKRGHRLTREEAESWVSGMRGEDPAVPHGGKWTMEQVKPIAIKYGIQPETEDFIELWATMNALYADYFAVAKKYNVVTPDFFADMAMAFIHDKDARPGKVAEYYAHIVEG